MNYSQASLLTDQIDTLPTFNKICLAQNLLKELLSMKERIMKSKEKMQDQIDLNSFKYYKNKLTQNEIMDFCKQKDPSESSTYKLLKLSNELDEPQINIIKEFFFIIRNNNNYMLKILNNCDLKYIKEVCFFVDHYFYENTINNNSSFIQEELMLIIYLLIEQIIHKNLDDILSYKKNILLYKLIKYLSNKPDIRNFLVTILSENILQFDTCKNDLAPNPNYYNYCQTEEISIKKITSMPDCESIIDNLIETEIVKSNKNVVINSPSKEKKKLVCKRTGSTGKRNVFNKNKKVEVKKAIEPQKNISNKSNKNIIKEKNIITLTSETPNYNIDNCEDEDVIKKFNDELKIKKPAKIYGDLRGIKVDIFFFEKDVNSSYIMDKISNKENEKTKKNNISYAMIYYLDKLVNEIISYKNHIEIYSIDLYLGCLSRQQSQLSRINTTNYDDCNSNSYLQFQKEISKIKENYNIITEFIKNLLSKIFEGIKLLPYSIKYISYITDSLIEKSINKKDKKGKAEYYKIMARIKILFFNIIIPMLKKPTFNGIITDSIISKTTKNNLNVISKILIMSASGKLFDNTVDVEFTIYNSFIINIMQQLFEIVEKIPFSSNEEKPEIINKLISSYNNIENYNRIIEYNNLKNIKENIRYQSICFSWKILYIFGKIIERNKDYFLKDNNSAEEKKIFREITEINKIFSDNVENNNKNKIQEFFYISKFIYKKEFEQKIDILKDNFEVSSEKNDNVSRFKKCISYILSHINNLHKENFTFFMRRKNSIKLNRITDEIKVTEYKKNMQYQKTTFETKTNKNTKTKKINWNIIKVKNDKGNNNENKIKLDKIDAQFFMKRLGAIYLSLYGNKEEDCKFEDVIFSHIMSLAQEEIGTNYLKDRGQRIIFCISYIQNNINNLPEEYIKNNFSKLFMEIIEETKITIKEFEKNLLTDFYINIKNSEKLNLIISNECIHFKKMQQNFCINYLFNKIIIRGELKETRNNDGIITNIKFELSENLYPNTILNFIYMLPNFNDFLSDNSGNIINIEKNANLIETMNNYFQQLTIEIKKQKIINKFSTIELLSLIYNMQDYIHSKLYNKIYPSKPSIEDIFFEKKCTRLQFIKQENIIKNKKFFIDNNLLQVAIDHIIEMDNKHTPIEKIKSFGKALNILSNTMTINTGRSDFGIDDNIPLILYTVIKAKPKMMISNYDYSNEFINKELSKKQYGSILVQMGMVSKIITNMKYTDLEGVTEKEFGVDE